MSSFKKQMLKLKKQEILLKLLVSVLTNIVLNGAPPIFSANTIHVEQHQTINNQNDKTFCSSLLLKNNNYKTAVSEQQLQRVTD